MSGEMDDLESIFEDVVLQLDGVDSDVEQSMSLFTVFEDIESPVAFAISPDETASYAPLTTSIPGEPVYPLGLTSALSTFSASPVSAPIQAETESRVRAEPEVFPPFRVQSRLQPEETRIGGFAKNKKRSLGSPVKGKKVRPRKTGPLCLKTQQKSKRCVKALESYNNVPLARLLPKSTKRVIKRPGSYTMIKRRRRRLQNTDERS